MMAILQCTDKVVTRISKSHMQEEWHMKYTYGRFDC